MAAETKRTTIYLDPELHRALRLKAINVSRSVSDLVNEAVRESLAEDADDIEAFDKRAVEPLISYDKMPKRLVDKDQAYFWTEEWQEKERKVDEDIKTGRVRVFNTAAELLKELEEE
jgi:hypothetical protein